MLQLEKEFLNNYFSKLKIKGDSENVRKKTLYSRTKVIILRELLENNIPISQLAEKHNVHLNEIYNWKKKLFESAADIFNTKSDKQSTSLSEKKVEKLEEKLKLREEAVNYLVRENIELKKTSMGGLNGLWVEPDTRDNVINFISIITQKTEIKVKALLKLIDINSSK